MLGALAPLLVLLAQPVPDDLLRKLADRDARLLRLYKEGAVTMTSRVEELDKAGKLLQPPAPPPEMAGAAAPGAGGRPGEPPGGFLAGTIPPNLLSQRGAQSPM